MPQSAEKALFTKKKRYMLRFLPS